MTARYDIILRRVRPMGERAVDIGIRDGKIAAIAERLESAGPEYDGKGRDVIPGLQDHHIHLFATAAQRASVDLSECRNAGEIADALHVRAATQAASGWIRATGFVETGDRLPERSDLDLWINDRPLRIQDRTGALWLLNSAAIARLGSGPYPPCVELDRHGNPTGRIWRGDAWLRTVISSPPPSLRELSLSLAAEGVTAVTDAGAANGSEEARLFEAAIGNGELVQRLTVMGTEELPESGHYRRGPLKLHYDERDPVDPEQIASRIGSARVQGRNVAAHCVTFVELLLYLEALALAGGAQPGDRIEHGSMIPESFIADVAATGLTVVTQPGFIHSRGDRYVATVDPAELDDLYRLRTLIAAGISVRAGSDAPYGAISPWQAMVAARTRKTRGGGVIGASDALASDQVATVFGLDRRDAIRTGMAADLCVLAEPLIEVLGVAASSPVDLTVIGGIPTYERP